MKTPTSLALLFAIAPLGWAGGSTARPVEATALMERLTGKIEHAQKLHADTAREIARLMSQPWFDCNRVTCSEALRVRNAGVRQRLKLLVAGKTL